MRLKSAALLVLALGCGLIASIGITQVMAKRPGEPAGPAGDTETVFVALEDVALGDILEPQILRLEQWPKDKVAEGALTKIEDVEGRRTKTKLYAGEPILEKKLYPKGAGAGGVSPRIPKGYRVIPVRVDSVTGAHGMILPGDRVDVVLFVAEDKSGGGVQAGVHTILQDIKVFACNDVVELEAGDDPGTSIKAQTISLLVTPEQSKKVALASELGKIRLVMRSPEDDAETTDEVLTAADLFHVGVGKGNRTEDSPGERSPADQGNSKFQDFLDRIRRGALSGSSAPTTTDVGPNRHAVRVVLGPQIHDFVLESEGNPEDIGPGHWKLLEPTPPPEAPPTGTADAAANLPWLSPPSGTQNPGPDGKTPPPPSPPVKGETQEDG